MKKSITAIVTLAMMLTMSISAFAQGEEKGVLPPLGKNYIQVVGATCEVNTEEGSFYPDDMEEKPSQNFDVELTYNKPKDGKDVITTQTFKDVKTNSYENVFETDVSPAWVVGIKVSSSVDIEFTDFYFITRVQNALPELGGALVNDDIVASDYCLPMSLSLKSGSTVELLKDHPKNYMTTEKYEPYLCNAIEIKVNVKTPINAEKADIPVIVEVDGNNYVAKYSYNHNNESLATALSTQGEKTLVFEIYNEEHIDLSKISSLSFLQKKNNSGLDMEIMEVHAMSLLDTLDCLKFSVEAFSIGKMSVNSEMLPVTYNGNEIKLDKFDLTTPFDTRYIDYVNGTEYVGSIFGEGNAVIVLVGTLLIGIGIGFATKTIISKKKSVISQEDK